MANELYKNFPEVQYTLSNGKIVTIKDFFRKAKLETSQLSSFALRKKSCLLYTSDAADD